VPLPEQLSDEVEASIANCKCRCALTAFFCQPVLPRAVPTPRLRHVLHASVEQTPPNTSIALLAILCRALADQPSSGELIMK
jgi:hypothetical protein